MNETNEKKRMCGKKFFFTFSQCPAPQKVLYDKVYSTFPDNIDRLIVGRETHQDGNYHLHGAVWLKKRIDRVWDPRILDFTYDGENYHPKLEVLKNDIGARLYVCKEGDVLANFNWLEWKSKREGKGKTAKIFDEVINKKRPLLEAIKEVDLGMIRSYTSLKNNLNEFLRDCEDNRIQLPTFLSNPWGKCLITRRKSKKRHYWIYSRLPNKGKTTMFAEPMEEAYRVVIKTGDFQYWRVQDNTECIILDDYNGAKLKYYELNQMCDGSFEYRIFQGGLKKLKKPLIIVLSNQCIKDLYPNMFELLYARFNEIELV